VLNRDGAIGRKFKKILLSLALQQVKGCLFRCYNVIIYFIQAHRIFVIFVSFDQFAV